MIQEDKILWFKDISVTDIPKVGGKGANLGEMTRNKFSVPGGFVITAQTYFKFLEECGIKKEIEKKIDAIDVEDTANLEKVSEEVRNLINAQKTPEDIKQEILIAYKKIGEKKIAWLSSNDEALVAVRSSATAEDLPEASFAGQQETYLNVKGTKELLEAVKNAWASLFTARAVYYRKKQGFETEKVGIAIVVQKMVESKVSGIMFTADPLGNRDKIVIEAGLGLGESVVSGSITPDYYVVDKKSMKLIEKKINHQDWKIIRQGRENAKIVLSPQEAEKQKMKNEQIIELAKIGKKIEDHYKKPMDIEWAIEDKEIMIVQARPITTLENKKEIKELETTAKPILEGLAGSPGVISGKVKIVLNIEDITKVKTGDILVTIMTSPSWVPVMKKASAIITNEGGRTAHAAIVSRELGIPAVVGTREATKKLKDNQEVTVDGFNGKVYDGIIKVKMPKHIQEELFKAGELDAFEDALEKKINTPQDTTEEQEYEKLKQVKEKAKQIIEEYKKIREETMNKDEIKKQKEELEEFLKKIAPIVKVNVAMPSVADKAAQTNADGVGLLRAEHMITASGKHPAQYLRENNYDELVKVVKDGIKTVAEKFEKKPVWFRTFDARTDEFVELKGGSEEPKEDNPMLGWHGIRRDLDQPKLLQAQMQAIKELQEEGLTNIGIMFPFVQSVEELIEAKKIMQKINLNVEVGVMIETPASVWIIEELINEGIDFISFGTNDLTQLTLGIDRNNELIQKHFTELHPAILKEIQYVIKRCKKANVKTSICGQAASNPQMVKKLVEMGIDSISANIDAVQEIKNLVLQEEKEQIMKTRKRNN